MTRFPVTVKDAQRFVSMKRFYRQDGRELRSAIRLAVCRTIGEPCASYPAALSCELARLAQKHGPNHVLLASPEAESKTSDREHKTGSDEVAEQSENPSEDSEMHGGDSASGEVESGTSKGGDNNDRAPSAVNDGEMGQGKGGPRCPEKTADANTGDEPDESAGETGESTSPEAHNKHSGGTNGLRADAQGERSASDTSALSENPKTAGEECPINTSSAGEDDPRSQTDEGQESQDTDALCDPLTDRANHRNWDASPDAQGKKVGVSETKTENYRYRSVKKRGSGKVSNAAKRRFGGITARLRQAEASLALVNSVRKALARLVDGGESQAGPRWDWTEFSKRLKTARPVYLARKEEEGRPAILVLADVSGSCSGFSDKSVIVARAAAQLGVSGADVIVVTHSNGYPLELKINSDEVSTVDDGVGWKMTEEASQKFYASLVRRFDIQAVVAMGDWDAEWLYVDLASLPQIKRFVWLDNWSCNTVPPTPRQDKLAERGGDGWEGEKRKVKYVIGCKDADDFVNGLRIALK